jgi:two-component sensor histidine kinase
MTNRSSQPASPQEYVLLNELNHRIRNELNSVISVMSLAPHVSDEEARVMLIRTIELLRHFAGASERHGRFTSPNDAGLSAAMPL